jgi:hypothetical protein
MLMVWYVCLYGKKKMGYNIDSYIVYGHSYGGGFILS